MREIGGYIELDDFHLPMLHEEAIALNCGRNALAYLIKTRNIKKIWMPYYLCDSVIKVCEKYMVKIMYYHVRNDFLPENIENTDQEWVYIVNYYGQLTETDLLNCKKKYKNIIIDNAQDYFARPLEKVDTIYTCRKYFGVPDGAFLYTDQKIKQKLERDESYERIRYILGRYERTASEFYGESVENNKHFASEPIKEMSHLTYNLLHAIDYVRVEEQRRRNFSKLACALDEINQLCRNRQLRTSSFMYPLMIDDTAEIRRKLQKKKIYIPVLWPNVLNNISETWNEWKLAQNILPLPIDQRYNEEDMNYLIEEIEKCIN